MKITTVPIDSLTPHPRNYRAHPDDFILTGTFAQQWERLGRAVSPPMMAAVAAHIRDHVLPAPEGA